MPELPEVETLRRGLAPRVIGRTFTGADLLWPRAVHKPTPDEFRRLLPGQRIDSIERRGKYLLFRLSGGQTLILHLRMSGWLRHASAGASRELYCRNVFSFDDGTGLQFCDKRKLGVMWLVDDAEEVVGKLGPDPLSPKFTAQQMAERLKHHSAPIKAVLCDQEVLAGVGNMYADEALFAARIHPLTRAGDLTVTQIRTLHRAVRQVLTRGLSEGGASVSDYKDVDGNSGNSQSNFAVAHQRGKLCPVCGTGITRIVVRQRGTYFCPKCQKPTN